MVDEGILRKLDEVERKFEDLEKLLSDPELKPDNIHKYSKERSDIEDVVSTYREYKTTVRNIDENKTLIYDKDLGELAQQEIEDLKEKQAELENKLKLLLIPKDPKDEKNVFLEIRAGTGGSEAGLFAGDLLRMYARYCETKRWKLNIISMNETDLGGIKELIATIEGGNVYSKLKYESGVHRVQRIPATETGGRIHTSTATVAILPEVDDVDIDIDEKDLRIDTYRASGAGGQHVNKTDSAIRITHIPSGIVVQCQDERSQHKNRAQAMKMLKAKLFEVEEEKRLSEISSNRKSQVGTGERSEKIRTYNFPQGRITDHRIGLTLHKMESILDGDIDDLLESLSTYFQAESLKEISEP
ncbi:MAG: peptide chain release factor 1 [Thermodesulfobacteriota bacterium]